MSGADKAVFLSYASQDAGAAKKICEALRAAGVEVWFDADGGLEHGDEWDRKIRGRIKECVLFLPVISANTQARHEGYFRIEWELAAERAMGIAAGVPFILPIVIDDTREPDALVPDRFRKVQWTKLRDGAVPPEVLARFLKLWSHRTGVLSHEAARAGGAPGDAAVSPVKSGAKSRALIAAAVAIVIAGAGWWMWQRRAQSPALAESVPPASPASEAGQLVRQARDLVYDPDSARNEFALAENLLKRATDLAPTSGAAWGASALLNHYFYSRNYDQNRQRLERSQTDAEKALRLEAHNADALLALGLHRQALGENDRAQDYLDRARAVDPQNFKVILAQSLQLTGHAARAKFLLEAAGRVPRPAELLYYASIELMWDWRFDEARAAAERAVAAQPFWRAFVQGAVVELSQSADVAKVNAWLDKVPELKRDEPRVAFVHFETALLQRDGAAAVRALTGLAADDLHDSFYTGPKAYLLGQAYELAGQPGRAAEQWQLAERTLREKLAGDPGWILGRAMLALSLAMQHRPAEARIAADACAADERLREDTAAAEQTAQAYVILGEPARAIALLRVIPAAIVHNGSLSAAVLAADPQWDALRDQPGYAQLAEELKRAEKGEANDSRSASVAPDSKSIAVLPFANLSPDKENEFFADGVHEDVITNLAKIRELKVISRTSVLAYRDPAARNLKKIAGELGVATVLEGSVRRVGNKVRVTAQLIDARTDQHLWAETYDRDLTDVFAIQSALATDIAAALRTTLTASERTLIENRPTSNQDAYDLFLRARAHGGIDPGREELDQVVAFYQQAIAKDPTFALAYAELSWAHSTGYWDAALDPTPERRERARIAAETAVRLAPDLPQARAALGEYYYRCLRDWPRALAEYRVAEAGIPNDASLLRSIAFLDRRLGHWPEAIEYFARSETVDPRSAPTPGFRAQTLGLMRRFTDLSKQAGDALVRFPDSGMLLSLQALAQYELSGDRAAYIRRLEAIPVVAGDPEGLRVDLAMAKGDLEAADRILADMRLGIINSGRDAAIADPVALRRALVAFLRGQREPARRFADEAIAYYRGKQWAPRQESWVLMGIAQAHALAGRTVEALRDGPAALAMEEGHDLMTAVLLRSDLGRIYAALDRREEAITVLRTMMTGPSGMTPQEVRHDPLWSRLKDDPRFEEILKAAKPL